MRMIDFYPETCPKLTRTWHKVVGTIKETISNTSDKSQKDFPLDLLANYVKMSLAGRRFIDT